MSTERKLDHEEFEISKEKREKLVRQERHTDDEGKCFAVIDKTPFAIVDYSYFGIAFNSKTEYLKDTKLSDVTFSSYDHNFGTYSLRVKRCVKQDDGTFKVATEITGDSLPIDSIIAHKDGQNVINEHESYVGKVQNIDPEFRLAVFEAKSTLNHLKEKINKYEQEQMFYTEDERKVFEEAVSENIRVHLEQYFAPFYDKAADYSDGLSKEVQNDYYNFFRSELHSILYLSPFANRSYYKPNGYAGDFEMMNILYRNELVGNSLFAKGLHKYFVNHPNAKAVRNRSHYLFNFLKKQIEKNPNKKLKILSVASGPAREIQMLLEHYGEAIYDKIEVHLLDQDLFSLKHAQRAINKIVREDADRFDIKYHNYSIKNVITEGLTEDYDVIYSAGLFDYFSEPVAKQAANQLFAALRNGGTLNIGNFCFQESSAALMMYALDWYLIYRSEETLKTMYSETTQKIHVESEEQGVNLFVVMEK